MKILHIIDTLSIGGAEKLVVGVINGLPQHQHYLVYLSGADTLSREVPLDCRIIKLNCRSKLDIPRSIIRLKKLIRRESIAIVHSHLFMSTLIARLACPRRCRLITTLHSLAGTTRYKHSNLVKWLDKITYRSRHHIIAVSEEVFQAHKKEVNFSGPYSILTNYVEDVFFRPDYKRTAFDKTLRLVTVGNLKKVKNHNYLLEAFLFLSPAIKLDIYGSGELEDRLQKRIIKYNLPVSLRGERSQLHKVLPEYDAFIMPSRYEGNPLALLEAMASGLPVILSDIPAFRQVVGNDAVYFNLNNPFELAQKLLDIYDKKIDIDSIARANFEKVKQIGIKELYLRKLQAIYLNNESATAKVNHQQIDLQVQKTAG